jgi:hypothetical protein
MRVKAGIWVSAYVRRVNAAAAMAVVARRGDGDAGAIFIKLSTLDGLAQVLRPASSGIEGAESERFWSPAFKEPRAEAEADAYLARQRDFDADLWIVEVEDKAGRHFLDDCVISA